MNNSARYSNGFLASAYPISILISLNLWRRSEMISSEIHQYWSQVGDNNTSLAVFGGQWTDEANVRLGLEVNCLRYQEIVPNRSKYLYAVQVNHCGDISMAMKLHRSGETLAHKCLAQSSLVFCKLHTWITCYILQWCGLLVIFEQIWFFWYTRYASNELHA